MIIKNEKNYPMFLRYAGKARAGRDLRAGECSPQCPLDRLQLQVMQNHIRSGIISVFITEAEKVALTGNVPQDILDALKVEAPNDKVTIKEAPAVAQVAAAAPAPVTNTAFNALMEDPIVKYAKKPKKEVPVAEVPSEEGHSEDTVEEVKEAEEVTAAPVVKPGAAAPAPAPVVIEDASEELEEEDPLNDQGFVYEAMNKQQLMDEIAKRGLRKPPVTTSAVKLRELLKRNDTGVE